MQPEPDVPKEVEAVSVKIEKSCLELLGQNIAEAKDSIEERMHEINIEIKKIDEAYQQYHKTLEDMGIFSQK